MKNRESNLKYLYEHLENREEYLRRFYKKSLKLKPTPLHDLSKTSPMKQYELNNNNSLVQYKNIIRNIHYLDILENTQSGFNHFLERSQRFI